MTTTYKGYEITQCASDRFIIRLNGVHMDTVKGSLSCAHFCIDSNFEDMTPQPVDDTLTFHVCDDFDTIKDFVSAYVYLESSSNRFGKKVYVMQAERVVLIGTATSAKAFIKVNKGKLCQWSRQFNVEKYKKQFSTPVDAYEGLDTEQTAGMPTNEEINKACGVKEVCSFMEAVEANVAETKDFTPIKERQLTDAQKHAYWDAYHEGYKQAQSELNHIVNP